jgi:hypothetical protein
VGRDWALIPGRASALIDSQIALRHTQFAQATCGTIRLKLFKIGALVRVSVRGIKIAMAPPVPTKTSSPSPICA